MNHFLINGTDILPLIAENGIKWSRSDIDGKNAGRNLRGTIIRDRIATKIRLDVTIRPITTDQMQTLMWLIEPEFVTIQYDDALYGKNVSKTMYSNNIAADLVFVYDNNTDLYENLTFPLVEK